jgi:toxin YoeB
MKFKIRLSKSAQEDIQRHRKSGNKKVLKKIGVLLEELQKHPRIGTGQPEVLQYELAGYYSRRINKKHRLVYKIEDEIITVFVASAYSHYGDK